MAVEQMKLISLFGSYEGLNQCIATLIDAGCFHPESAYTATLNTKGFEPISEVNPLAGRLQKLGEVLNYCGIDPSGIAGSDQKALEDGDIDRVLVELSNTLHDLQINREELLREMEECRQTLSALEHFAKLDIDLSAAENSDFIKVKFGRIPVDGYRKLAEYVDNPYIVFQACAEDKNSYWGVYLTPADHEEEVDRIFASLFFEQITLPGGFGKPSEKVAAYAQRLKKLQDALGETESTIDWHFNKQGGEFLKLYAQLKREYDINEYRRLAVRYHGQFATLIGWVPSDQLPKLIRAFEPMKDYTVSEVASGSTAHLGAADLVPPTRMRNKKLFRPFEFYVEIYGVPGYKEVDPTAFVAITYTLLYGIMFADVGQGLVLALAGLFMWYKMKMALGKILVPCGIMGSLFGMVFGSVFGNEELLNPMYHALGFAEKPIDIMSSATTLLAFSIGIGMVLILVAMIAGIVSNIKKKQYGMAIFGPNGVCGVILYSSIIVYALSAVMGVSVPTLPLLLAGIVLPLVLIFFHAPLCSLLAGDGFRVSPVGDFLLESVFELFETVLSYFTNTVSFLRVGAFVLIHAGMMMAFQALAGIVGGGIAGTVMMVFGNIFVIALEGLLVGIQVLRLEFYEMFSRFYDGDGYPFKPLSSAGNNEPA